MAAAPEAEQLVQAFPRMLDDPLQAQAALTFLLIKNRVATSITLGPGFDTVLAGEEGKDIYAGGGLAEGVLLNPPIAFDFSHQAHRAAQAFMWDRLLSTADRLIDLLQGVEYEDGESLWDRTLIYVATEFGRSKSRPSGAAEFGSAHHLNNGSLLLSPMVRGNRVLGGVDPDTGLTYGFDPSTGDPEPGRQMTERELYAGILSVLGVPSDGADLPDMSILRRS